MSALGLRVLRILHLQQACAVRLVDTVFSFADDSFQISCTNLFEECDTLGFDVLCVDQSLTLAPLDEFAQTLLTLYQRQGAQILLIEPQQVEGTENGIPLPREQRIELMK